jgi:ComF family protein
MNIKPERFFSLAREYLFPQGCAVCRRTLIDQDEAWYGLCADCQILFPVEREERCESCGRPLISEIDRCLDCRSRGNALIDGAVSLFHYSGHGHRLLEAYKFDRYFAAGNFLAEKARAGLACFSSPVPEGAVLTPVPPRPGKVRQEGWDQTDYAARRLAKDRKKRREEGAPALYPCLKRLSGMRQKRLSLPERLVNLAGKIQVTCEIPPAVILFDDVITTGATLLACAAALKRAGAEQVYTLTLFYT